MTPNQPQMKQLDVKKSKLKGGEFVENNDQYLDESLHNNNS